MLMHTATWILSLAALAGGTSAEQPTPQDELSIGVLIRTVPLSGRGYGTAGSDRGSDVFTRVTADENFCRAGAGDFGLQRQHDYSWELTGRIVARTADTVTADVTWKQLEGPGAGGLARTQTVTLRSGERVVLETIRPATTTGCAAQGTLEVEAGPRISALRAQALTMMANARADLMTRSAGGTGGVAAGGVGSGSGAGNGSGVSAGSGRGGGGGGGSGFSLREPGSGDLTLPPGSPFTVEIWLVRTLPNGTERVEAHDRAENIATVSKKFGPVAVTTSSGNVSVMVGVDLRSLARQKDPLLILVNRDENAGGKIARGGTSRVGDIPADTEIISLELPPSELVADRFSVRLKFTKPLSLLQ